MATLTNSFSQFQFFQQRQYTLLKYCDIVPVIQTKYI